MTGEELKNFIDSQFVVPLTEVSKLKDVCKKIVDFISAADNDEFPVWTALLNFKTDGTDAGKYCIHPDVDNKLRIFETKTNNNIGNTPPTDPLVSENTYWKEISASAAAALPEWSAGLFTSGLKIVYHNHSTQGRGLYLLLAATRPFNSTNIETEIIAGLWDRVGGVEEKFTSDPTLSIPSGFTFGKYQDGDTPPWTGLTAMQAIVDALTSGIPGNAVLYDDDSPLLYDDNSNVLYDV